MAEREGNQPQVEDIKHDGHDGTIGEDFTDSYADAPGNISVLRKTDATGYLTNHYKFEVQSEEYETRGKQHQKGSLIDQIPVTSMRKAELDLRKEFNYTDQDKWFIHDSPEEVKSKSREIQKKREPKTAAE
jgi:hypothetical protein